AGALPWILYNIRYSLPSLRESYAGRPVHGIPEAVSNLQYFFTYNVRELAIGWNPLFENAPVTPLEGWLRIPAAVIYALSVLALIAFSVILFKRTADRRQLSSFLLVWLVLGTVALLYSLSEAGEGRGLTVRYVLPLYI